MLLALGLILGLGLYAWRAKPASEAQVARGGVQGAGSVHPLNLEGGPERKIEERARVALNPAAGARLEQVPVQSIPGRLIIVGRCLRQEDMLPLVGCEVFLEHPITDLLNLPGPHSPIMDTTAIHDWVMNGLGATHVDARWPRAIHRDRLFLVLLKQM